MKILFLFILWPFLFVATSVRAVTPASIPSDTAHFYTSHSFNVLKYNLDIGLYHCYFDPYPKSFSARQQITLQADSVLNFIMLNALNTSMIIDSVKLAGTSFIHDLDTLKIFLDRSYLPGEILSVSIFYRHMNVNDKGFYAYNPANPDSKETKFKRKIIIKCENDDCENAHFFEVITQVSWKQKASIINAGVADGECTASNCVITEETLYNWY